MEHEPGHVIGGVDTHGSVRRAPRVPRAAVHPQRGTSPGARGPRAALVAGRWGGALSALIAALCFDFFLTRPYSSLTINRSHDVETTLILLVVGLVVGELVTRARRTRRRADASRREIDQIHRVAELAAGNGSAGRLITIVEREVVDVLGARGARFERPPSATLLPNLGHGVVTIPSGRDDTDRAMGPRNEVALPVVGQGHEIGRLVLVLPRASSGADLEADDRALVDQLGAVLATAAKAG